MILHLHLKNYEKELFAGKLNKPAASLSLTNWLIEDSTSIEWSRTFSNYSEPDTEADLTVQPFCRYVVSYPVIYLMFIHNVGCSKFMQYSWKAQYLIVPAVRHLNLIYENVTTIWCPYLTVVTLCSVFFFVLPYISSQRSSKLGSVVII